LVPLRTVLWLLLAVVAGSTIGFRLGLPGSDPAPVAASADAGGEASSGLEFAPPTGRPVTPHELDTGGPSASPGLQPLSSAASSSATRNSSASASGDSSAMAFDAPYAADLSFLTFGPGPAASTTGAPTTGPTETTTFTTTPAPPGPPPLISDVRTVSLSPFAATISWRTNVPATSRLVYGLDAPVVWSAPTTLSTTHQATMTGLGQSRSYRLDIAAQSEDEQTVLEEFLLTTPAINGPVRASVGGSTILLDGRPWFPKMVWAQCPDAVGGSIAVGIDLFMGNGCGSGAQLATWLGTAAFVLADAKKSEAERAGALGVHLPDEWDTGLPNDFSLEDAMRAVPARPDSGPRFLTLTNHFYSRAEPLPQGRGMYPGLAASADVLGFDLYPLQNWCRWDSFHDVFDSQIDLVSLARGKPTFQWIEARRMDCKGEQLDPTPETVRAESWLSIAAGAHAIGYFPNNWTAAVGAEIARTNREIDNLVSVLVEPNIAASVAVGSSVKAGAREHNGAVYVIAVNASRGTSSATITVPALADRTLRTLDGLHTVTASGGSFTDNFGPLEVRIYIAAPA
jgi:hypothetical protein